MKPVYFIAIAILAVGFWVWKVSENKNKQDMQAHLAALEEANTISEIKPKLEGVNEDELEEREGIMHLKDSKIPYTGKTFGLCMINGLKASEANWKNGKKDGLAMGWHIGGGTKWYESNYKDGKRHGLHTAWRMNEKNGKLNEVNYIDDEEVKSSNKWWNSKGEPVDSQEEAY